MKNERISYPSLIAVSVIVPVATAWLLYSNHRQGMASGWVAFLPHFHASLNALTILTLLTGFILIRLKIIRWHRMAMTTSFFMGVLFLVSYFIYHYLAPPAIYGDLNHDGILDLAEAETVGNARNIYLLILVDASAADQQPGCPPGIPGKIRHPSRG